MVGVHDEDGTGEDEQQQELSTLAATKSPEELLQNTQVPLLVREGKSTEIDESNQKRWTKCLFLGNKEL